MRKVFAALFLTIMFVIIGLFVLGYAGLVISNSTEPSDDHILSLINSAHHVDVQPYSPHILTKHYGTNFREEFFYTVVQVDIPPAELSLMIANREVTTLPTSAIENYSTLIPAEVFPSLPEHSWYVVQAKSQFGLQIGFFAISSDGKWFLAEFDP